MTQVQFARTVVGYNRDNPQQRAGQALFNCLWEHRPDIANMVRGTDNDPFYDDKKIPGCWERIITFWDRTVVN